jgi:RNA-directed DNA polymerase
MTRKHSRAHIVLGLAAAAMPTANSIPKKTGGERILGVPTVSDRIAQMVVKQMIEPKLEAIFLPDSYGYRPGKSALDAVGVAPQRCWKYDWLLQFDIKGLFDNIPHDLLPKAVRKNVQCKWALLYIERWLTAPMAIPHEWSASCMT